MLPGRSPDAVTRIGALIEFSFAPIFTSIVMETEAVFALVDFEVLAFCVAAIVVGVTADEVLGTVVAVVAGAREIVEAALDAEFPFPFAATTLNE